MKSFSKKYNGKKVSDIFKEYVDPLLDLYFESTGKFNASELEQILQLPWLVWNSMVIRQDVKNKIDYHASIDLLLKNRPDARMVVDAMRRRKKEMFDQYDFLFGNYKINFNHETQAISLWAEARTLSK